MVIALIILVVGILLALAVMWYTVCLYRDLERRYHRLQRINDRRYDHVLAKITLTDGRVTALERRAENGEGKHCLRNT